MYYLINSIKPRRLEKETKSYIYFLSSDTILFIGEKRITRSFTNYNNQPKEGGKGNETICKVDYSLAFNQNKEGGKGSKELSLIDQTMQAIYRGRSIFLGISIKPSRVETETKSSNKL